MSMKLDFISVAVAGLIVAVAIGVAEHVLGYPIRWHVIGGGILLLLVFTLAAVTMQGFRAHWLDPAGTGRRLRIIESNYGRDAGWYVELEGRRVAILSYPREVDMFWVSYRIEPLTEDAGERQRIQSDPSWWHQKLTFRNREFNEIATLAFAGGEFSETCRVPVRGLYLNIHGANTWERLLLYLRRRNRKSRKA